MNESIYDEYRPYRPISMESEVIATDIEVTAADTEVIATDTDQKREQRESAYVSRKRMWRTPPEPSSNLTSASSDVSLIGADVPSAR